jgi:hypothetical protein
MKGLEDVKSAIDRLNYISLAGYALVIHCFVVEM